MDTLQIETLSRRADFLRFRELRGSSRMDGAGRVSRPAFLLLYAPFPFRDTSPIVEGSQNLVRVGYTVTRKLGGAVRRNRIKRRLRAAISRVLPEAGYAGYDYVLIARPQAWSQPFEEICDQLKSALVSIAISRQNAGRYPELHQVGPRDTAHFLSGAGGAGAGKAVSKGQRAGPGERR